eukprot:scaffold868_cov249-Pinguiococcus_pyrenoidosus.AAC.12
MARHRRHRRKNLWAVSLLFPSVRQEGAKAPFPDASHHAATRTQLDADLCDAADPDEGADLVSKKKKKKHHSLDALALVLAVAGALKLVVHACPPTTGALFSAFWWGGGLPDDIAHGAGAARARWGNE